MCFEECEDFAERGVEWKIAHISSGVINVIHNVKLHRILLHNSD